MAVEKLRGDRTFSTLDSKIYNSESFLLFHSFSYRISRKMGKKGAGLFNFLSWRFFIFQRWLPLFPCTFYYPQETMGRADSGLLSSRFSYVTDPTRRATSDRWRKALSRSRCTAPSSFSRSKPGRNWSECVGTWDRGSIMLLNSCVLLARSK